MHDIQQIPVKLLIYQSQAHLSATICDNSSTENPNRNEDYTYKFGWNWFRDTWFTDADLHCDNWKIFSMNNKWNFETHFEIKPTPLENTFNKTKDHNSRGLGCISLGEMHLIYLPVWTRPNWYSNTQVIINLDAIH